MMHVALVPYVVVLIGSHMDGCEIDVRKKEESFDGRVCHVCVRISKQSIKRDQTIM